MEKNYLTEKTDFGKLNNILVATYIAFKINVDGSYHQWL